MTTFNKCALSDWKSRQHKVTLCLDVNMSSSVNVMFLGAAYMACIISNPLWGLWSLWSLFSLNTWNIWFQFLSWCHRAAFETLPPFVHWNKVKRRVLFCSLYSKWRDQSGKVHWNCSKSYRAVVQEQQSFFGKTGWTETWYVCGVFGDLLAWLFLDVWQKKWIYTISELVPRRTKQNKHDCFVPPAGPPYGWEEAYTADGVKYYIK